MELDGIGNLTATSAPHPGLVRSAEICTIDQTYVQYGSSGEGPPADGSAGYNQRNGNVLAQHCSTYRAQVSDQRHRSPKILSLVLALVAVWAFAAVYADSAAAQTPVADPNQVTFGLQGCRPGAALTFPAAGPFVCPDADYTPGNLGKSWNEGDYVPFRLTADNRDGTQTYNVVIAGDYRRGSGLGFDDITAPALNAGLSDPGCNTPVAGPVQHTPAAIVGGADQTIFRTLTITQPAGATCVYDYAQRLAMAFPGRTAAASGVAAPLGASSFPGSSLQAYLLNQDLGSAGVGQRRVPLPVDQAQGFAKTVAGLRGTGFSWSVTKSSGPASLPDTCTAATTSEPVSIRVEWTKTQIPGGGVAVTTTFAFDNPAHRRLDVSVSDTLRENTAAGAVIDGPFTETFAVNPGHHEFSVTRDVTTAADTLFNTATATYTDPRTDDVMGQIVATDTGAVTTAVGAAINDTATITDVEQITGALTFSVEDVVADPALPDDGFTGGYVPGTETTGPLTWTSGTVDRSGSVTFTKLVHAAPGVTTSGVLSDDATLQPADTGAVTAHAETPIQAVGCGTVSGAKFNDVNANGTRDAGEPGLSGWTFFVDYDDDGTLDAGEPSAQSAVDGSFTIAGVRPGTFTLREVAQAAWVCTTPAPCTYAVTLSGDASTGNVFGNHQLTPSILLDKTGPATAEAGSIVAYTINITNNGELPLSAVVVTDPLCTAAPTLVSKNGDPSPTTLDPTVDRWTYTCSVQTQAGQTSVDNVANVSASDEFQRVVTATDNAVTALSQPIGVTPVAPTPLVAAAAPAPPASGTLAAVTGQSGAAAGTARLRGPSRCVSRTFTATVTGTKIARVRFYVDGRLKSTLTRANASNGRFVLRVSPASYRASKHRIVARIQFTAASQTAQRTQSLPFQRCGRAVAAPVFTG